MKNLQNETTVLLIESNSGWLADVRSVLHEAGYDVLTATGGDQGFCVARRIQPDLIICEAALPDLTGVQLCYMVRADKNLHAALFILMGETSGHNCDTAAEGMRAGADDCFKKNCSREFLAAKIARLLNLRRFETELRRRCRNLHRSEFHLAKIIEDTFNLVTALDPAHSLKALNAYEALKLKRFFGSPPAPKKQSLRKNAKALKIWEPTLKAKEFVETNKFANEKRETVYYEIVC